MSPDRRIYANPETAARVCGDYILSMLQEAIADRGVATIAVSGGSTPNDVG